jgi:uncharacterized protein with HEPN domain
MKSGPQRDKILLSEILGELKVIDERVIRGKAVYDNNDELRDAIAMRLITLSELLNALSDQFYEEHPEVPMSRIRGLRNVLVHQYGEVDFERLWNIIDKDYAQLSVQLRQIASQNDAELI